MKNKERFESFMHLVLKELQYAMFDFCILFFIRITLLFRRVWFWIMKSYLCLHLKCGSNTAFSFFGGTWILWFKVSSPKISEWKKEDEHLLKIHSTHSNIEHLEEVEWVQSLISLAMNWYFKNVNEHQENIFHPV